VPRIVDPFLLPIGVTQNNHVSRRYRGEPREHDSYPHKVTEARGLALRWFARPIRDGGPSIATGIPPELPAQPAKWGRRYIKSLRI